jgi:hypothetical protein
VFGEVGLQTSVSLANTVLSGAKKVPKTSSLHAREAFSLLLFLFAVGKRNEVRPRTVANSDKENSQHRPATGAESTNPALTQTANPTT